MTTAIDRAAPGAACSSPAPRGCIFLKGHPAAQWDVDTVRDALRRWMVAHLREDLPILLTNQAATRQITPAARAVQPRKVRCALARDAG